MTNLDSNRISDAISNSGVFTSDSNLSMLSICQASDRQNNPDQILLQELTAQLGDVRAQELLPQVQQLLQEALNPNINQWSNQSQAIWQSLFSAGFNPFTSDRHAEMQPVWTVARYLNASLERAGQTARIATTRETDDAGNRRFFVGLGDAPNSRIYLGTIPRR